MTAILAGLASLGTIIGGLVYVFKYSAWALTKTPEQKKEGIDNTVQQKEQGFNDTGRPQ